MDPEPVKGPLPEAERIAYAYWVAARGDVWAKLVHAIYDALTDLAEAKRCAERIKRQVSRGYVRGRFDQPSR